MDVTDVIYRHLQNKLRSWQRSPSKIGDALRASYETTFFQPHERFDARRRRRGLVEVNLSDSAGRRGAVNKVRLINKLWPSA